MIEESGVELGAKNQDTSCTLDGKPSVGLAIYQLPGSNALKTADAIRDKMKELRADKQWPHGLEYSIVYDTTPFIDESIHEVVKALRFRLLTVRSLHAIDLRRRTEMSVSLRRPQRRLGRSVPSNGAAPAVALRDVQKVYGRGDAAVVALDGISIDFAAGSFTAIMGPSGSGKSTLLHMAAGLDGRPPARSCSVTRPDADVRARLTLLRRERIGFVFQAFNLMPSLTVAQNIGLPLRLDGRRADAQGREVAARVGLDERLRHRPAELSGGQQQRVAIARALVTRPEVVFADEPTGALDTGTGRDVLGLLRELVDVEGHTVVMVTHDPRPRPARIG